ncbi:MAG: hypothetical protein KDA42_09380 [Planctomycetales bacterium]|nr:hypothetical protein [Planctomycetales bacterium]
MRYDDFLPDFEFRDDWDDADEAELIERFRSPPFDFKADEPAAGRRSSKERFANDRRHGRKRGQQNLVFAPRKKTRKG